MESLERQAAEGREGLSYACGVLTRAALGRQPLAQLLSCPGIIRVVRRRRAWSQLQPCQDAAGHTLLGTRWVLPFFPCGVAGVAPAMFASTELWVCTKITHYAIISGREHVNKINVLLVIPSVPVPAKGATSVGVKALSNPELYAAGVRFRARTAPCPAVPMPQRQQEQLLAALTLAHQARTPLDLLRC